MGDARTAVVTGANRGIGKEIARQLSARGVHVIVCARSLAEARATADDVRGAEPFVLDVTHAERRDALAVRLRPGLDILVNNAGTSLDGFNADVARKTLDTNFYGAMQLTDKLLPTMLPGGRIVMVSSAMGELSCLAQELRKRFIDVNLTRDGLRELCESFVQDVAAGAHAKRGWPSSAYRVSKVAMNALTRILARELAGDHRELLVNAACPGWVRTRMGGPGAPRSIKQGAETPVWLALLPKGGPTGGFFSDERPVDW
jgi:NAD(P)-dependent dehydrogenase (short-subunit alcohol dehydrogenase family)